MKTLRLWMMVSAAVFAIPAFSHSTNIQNQPHPKDADRIKEQIVELEGRWQKAVLDRDRSVLNRLLALDFSEEEWVRNQIEPRRSRVRTIKRQTYLERILRDPFRKYDIVGDVAVVVKDPATAVAGLNLTVERPARIVPLSAADPRHSNYEVVDTWVKSADGWRVASRRVILAAGGMIIPLKNQYPASPKYRSASELSSPDPSGVSYGVTGAQQIGPD